MTSATLTNDPVVSPAAAQGGSPPTDLFQGYDSFVGSGRSTALTGTKGAAGATSQTYYKVCTDTASLYQAMNISGSVSASFGLGSVDAKMSFAQSLNVTSTSVTVVVYTNVITDSSSCGDVKLNVAPPKDITNFFLPYGDSYVSSITKGAEYIAVYVFQSTSITDQQSITASLNASDFGVSAQLSTAISSISTSTSTNVSMSQLMTGVSKPAYPNENDMITFALNFGTTKIDAPTVISFETTGYEHVPGLALFTKLQDNRNLILGNGAPGDPGLAGDYAALTLVLNQIDAIQNVYSSYSYYGDTTLPGRKTQVIADMQAITNLVAQMDNAPAAKYSAPSLPSLSYGTPTLTYSLGQPGGSIGLGGGTPFNDVSAATIAAGSTIAALTLYGSDALTGMEVTYTNGGGLVVHGSNTDPASQTLDYTGSEASVIVSIICDASGALYTLGVNQATIQSDGMIGTYTGSLSWPALTFPNGGSTAEATYPPGLPIGFFGSVDNGVLSQLSVVTLTPSPATWATPA